MMELPKSAQMSSFTKVDPEWMSTSFVGRHFESKEYTVSLLLNVCANMQSLLHLYLLFHFRICNKARSLSDDLSEEQQQQQ